MIGKLSSKSEFFPPATPLWMEKAAGRGEDGPVLLANHKSEGLIAIGVFDGLGGSGSRLLRREDGSEVSAARMAAEIAANTTAHALADFGFEVRDRPPAKFRLGSILGSSDRWSTASDFAAELQRRLERDFAEAASRFDGAGSAMRGSISKRLPTTLCLLVARQLPHGIQLSSIWAGDSRSYVWLPQRGLAQLTRDHTKQPLDALQAIREDAPMSNFVTPDLPFRLDLNEVLIDEACLFFCSTDGGFQFFPSPLEFELALIESLVSKSSWGDAVAALGARISAVTKDDVALGICGAGWRADDLQAQLRRSLQTRLKPAMQQMEQAQKRLDEASKRLRDAQHAVSALGEQLDDVRKDAWERYKVGYEGLIPPFLPSERRGAAGE